MVAENRYSVCSAVSEISNLVFFLSYCCLAHSILDFYGDDNLSIGI